MYKLYDINGSWGVAEQEQKQTVWVAGRYPKGVCEQLIRVMNHIHEVLPLHYRTMRNLMVNHFDFEAAYTRIEPAFLIKVVNSDGSYNHIDGVREGYFRYCLEPTPVPYATVQEVVNLLADRPRTRKSVQLSIMQASADDIILLQSQGTLTTDD